MRKFNLLFLALGFFAMSFLASCEGDSEAQPPLLTVSGITNNSTVIEGSTITIEVTAAENPTSKSNLELLTIDADGGTTEDVTEALSGASFTSTYDFIAPAAGQNKTISITLTDKSGATATKSYTVTGESSVTTTDLGTATGFTMVRCGGSNDPEAHGLQFDQVSGTSPNFNAVIITSTADKMVELTSGDWSSITTQEALMAAVDNGTASTSFNIDLNNGGSSDVVVATKEGSTYTLIHFDGYSSTSAACGTEYTLTGESKN